MKTMLMISWRNIWRSKRRSLVVIASVAIGIIGMLIMMSFMNSMTIQMIDNTINTSMGHIAIHDKGFQDSMKLKYNFSPDMKIRKIVKQQKGAFRIVERIKMEGMVSSSETSRRVMIMGVNPKQERNVSKIYDYTLKKNGSKFLTDSNSDSILISKSLAKKLQLDIGERIKVMIQDKNNKIQQVAFFIGGVFKTPMESFDKFVVFVGLQKMQQLTGIGNNISEINIILKDKENVDAAKASLISKINRKDLEILSWKDMAPQLVSAVKLFDSSMYIFFAIVFITVVFSIANTMVMAIMERFHEIGVMKSIGTKPSQIFSMILFEAVNLSFIGLLTGLIVSFIVMFYWSFGGLDLSLFSDGMRALGSGSILHPFLRIKDVVAAVGIVVFTAFIAALYPAIKAARIKPLEALHYV